MTAAYASPAYFGSGLSGRVDSDYQVEQRRKYELQMAEYFKEAEKFNNKNVVYKDWAIKAVVDKFDFELQYSGEKKGEEKKFSDTNMQNLEKRIDRFESEGNFRKALDRIL